MKAHGIKKMKVIKKKINKLLHLNDLNTDLSESGREGTRERRTSICYETTLFQMLS